MNPRHRRLLIPGLLVALLVVVVVASLASKADAAEISPAAEQVSTIDDPRVTEASGMAVSVEHDDLVYVINDSGSAPDVYAVRISTGEVVGTTTLTGVAWTDPEALAIDADGTLWVADTGDNRGRRDDVALYAFAEPGPGDRTLSPQTFPVTYPDGPVDVEAMLIAPDGTKLLVSKGLVTGEILRLPADLSESGNRVEPVVRISGTGTDGAFTPDGSRVLLRTYGDVRVLDTSDWSLVQRLAVPPVDQGETLAVEPGAGSFLIGSEGAGSPLLRVQLPAVATPTPTPEPTPTRVTSGGEAAPVDNGFAGTTWLGAAAVVMVLVGVSAWIARGR